MYMSVIMEELAQDESVLTLYQHWTKISKPATGLTTIFSSVEWPKQRGGHAATCVSGPLLVIIGGMMNMKTMTSDCWIYDFTTMLWKKVLVSEIMFVVLYDYTLKAMEFNNRLYKAISIYN